MRSAVYLDILPHGHFLDTVARRILYVIAFFSEVGTAVGFELAARRYQNFTDFFIHHLNCGSNRLFVDVLCLYFPIECWGVRGYFK